MRNTKQRELVYNIVLNNDKHYSADEIYNECKKIQSNISLATVYRNLNQLVDMKKIRRIKMQDNIDRYDKNIIHSHAICSKCGIIIDSFKDYIEKLPIISEFEITDYDLIFNGICNKCKKEDK